ncbi:Tri1 protein [Saccharomycopsis crataegensis]|uniref:Tri1 protein n=1 Tax=Saccharomycopsis crataegensis TaxID=43959 RepID=A0AAV5QVZ0_9ASCO|nr:Tri1 protein [Saccharomycopsis crataegensis]
MSSTLPPTESPDNSSSLQKYVPMIDAILSVSDLHEVTVKKIRNALQALFVIDLGPEKKPLASLIMERYYKLVDERESKAATKKSDDNDSDSGLEGDKSSNKRIKRQRKKKIDDEILATKLHASLNSRNLRKAHSYISPPPPRPKRGGGMPQSLLSNELKAFLNVDCPLPRTDIVKRVWAYIKEHDLQNPKDRREILCDENMRPVFGKKVTIFSMNKVLSKHLFSENEMTFRTNSPKDPDNDPGDD